MQKSRQDLLQFSRVKHLAKKEGRELYALLNLAIAQKTTRIRRENISRVVFYPDYNIAFNRIGKSGNSSVIFYLREAINPPKSRQETYKEGKRAAMKIGKSLIELSRHRGELSRLDKISFFTVVRNPWTRTLSAFLDKIANGPEEKYGSIPGFGKNSREGFAAFVSFLGDGGLHANHHWKPQKDVLLLPASHFRSICRLEHLASELPQALSATGLTLPTSDHLQQPHRIESDDPGKITNASSRLAKYYSPETLDAIANLYAGDFALGRYSCDPRSIGLSTATF